MVNDLRFCSQCYDEMNYSGNTCLDKFITICEFYYQTGQPFIESEADMNVQYLINHLENIKQAVVSTDVPDDPHMILIYPRGSSEEGFCFRDH